MRRTKFQRILVEYMTAQKLTLRGMANALTKALTPFRAEISYETIRKWRSGLSVPGAGQQINVLHLINLFGANDDWRTDFARDSLAALYPDEFKATGDIGKRILEGIEPEQAEQVA